MKITRREFLLLATGMVAGCKVVNDGVTPAASGKHTVNVGLLSNFATDGVYKKFRDLGFFVVRQGDKLFALSSYCTHRKCKLTAESDLSFYCKCHGSTFDPVGHVTEGPAKRDLPVLPAYTNEQGQLVVNVPAL